MNLKIVILSFLVVVQTVISHKQNAGYYNLFRTANSYSNGVNLAIKSPSTYEQFSKVLSKSTDLRSFSKLSHEVFSRVNVAADNVTEEPITTKSITTSSTTYRPTTPQHAVSEICQTQVDATVKAVSEVKPWALKMVDAAGKPPANILGGGFKWLGDYKECLSIKANPVVDNITYVFNGQYCMVSMVNTQPIPAIGLPKQTPINIGMCIPNGCSEQDTLLLVQREITNITNYQLFPYQVVCQEPDKPYDTRAIVVLVVIAFFISMMTMGTLYDVIVVQWPKWQRSAVQSEMRNDTAYEANEKSSLISEKNVVVDFKPGLLGNVLLAFSVYTNAAKILSTNQPPGSLTAINGIRFISMTWVILGHSYIFVLSEVENITTFLPEMLTRWTFGAVSNALVSVDTFFTLSGTLLTFLTLKALKKGNGKINWGMFYFHRFWRLTPPYMLIMMVYVALFPYIGSGPLWMKDGVEYNYCKKAWYYNLLYINNFFEKPEDSCMAWSWYLANDMQFFILSIIIIVPLYFFPIIGFAVIIAFFIGTWTATGVMATTWGVSMALFDGGDQTHWGTMYFRPYFRMGPYLVGMIMGYFLYKTDLKYRMKKIYAVMGWIIAATLACTVLYGQYDDINNGRVSQDISSFYTTVHRSVWGASIAWVIFACAHGYGGFINTILSWKGFIPLSRLTYCAYLVHPIVIYYYMFTRQRLMYFTDIEIIYQFLGHLGLSFAAAFIASLAFESPMMGLEKVLFKRSKK